MSNMFKGDPRAYRIAKMREENDEFDTIVAAAIEYMRRAARLVHPPGTFDDAGRWYADERTSAVRTCRSPSRAWPYSEMKAARTASHVAEVYEVSDFETEVRQIVNFVKSKDASPNSREVWDLINGAIAYAEANPKKTRKKLEAPDAETVDPIAEIVQPEIEAVQPDAETARAAA
ncbi:hypothetical protein HLH26_09020 [Gluconacetobacter sp. 1b LMG 1731]|uniref:Uncharacterized protein n=1 Tax=Gluconacetobacter dulcium TaxID=2729096 RepID=A0A7W4NSN0_9PROT|nr:hypothetical protein [Gluconacetobacter dulcium]MBB2164682.1 hypothetical protein [Gluconacetobacter dulcium]MBB2193818.1 hypothetical protein [Gluconacetobacter dulcium]